MKKLYLLISFCLIANLTFSQVGINTTTPDPSAVLDVTSNERGFLPPRLTTEERDAITNPAAGLIIYNRNYNILQYYNGTQWLYFSGIANDEFLPTTFTDTRDGQTYEIAKIGDQYWFAENLNYTPSSGNSWCYDDDPANCDIYGRLYDWNTLMNGESSSSANPSGVQGLCPSGWHVPSTSEWTQLTDLVGGLLNSSELQVLKSGQRVVFGSFLDLGNDAFWWSSEDGVPTNFAKGLQLNGGFIDFQKTLWGISCRCLRD